MLIKEYRLVLPMTVHEYEVGQLYMVANVSKEQTGGGEGIEVVRDEPFTATSGIQPQDPLLGGKYTSGQYTHKIYHIASKLPSYLRWIAPKHVLSVHEHAWNAYPFCRTICTNPDFMGRNFSLRIDSIHLPGSGDTENAHQLDSETLLKREVVKIDIANDHVESRDYKELDDPAKVHSERSGRGPLCGPTWDKDCSPVMCCYKLVTVSFNLWGLQGRVEKAIQKIERRIFLTTHRQLFCWMDQWYGLTMKEIRNLEKLTKDELDKQRGAGELRGLAED